MNKSGNTYARIVTRHKIDRMTAREGSEGFFLRYCRYSLSSLSQTLGSRYTSWMVEARLVTVTFGPLSTEKSLVFTPGRIFPVSSPSLTPWAPFTSPLRVRRSLMNLSLRPESLSAIPPSSGKNLSSSWYMRFFRVSSFSFSMTVPLESLIMVLDSRTNSKSLALHSSLVDESRSEQYFWNSDSHGVGRPDWKN